jgi:hypothetical protein
MGENMDNEPVAYRWQWDDGLEWHYGSYHTDRDYFKLDALYTHPHPDNLGLALSIIDQQKLEIEKLTAKTLTDEEIMNLALEIGWKHNALGLLTDFARAILRKAQEKC